MRNAVHYYNTKITNITNFNKMLSFSRLQRPAMLCVVAVAEHHSKSFEITALHRPYI